MRLVAGITPSGYLQYAVIKTYYPDHATNRRHTTVTRAGASHLAFLSYVYHPHSRVRTFTQSGNWYSTSGSARRRFLAAIVPVLLLLLPFPSLSLALSLFRRDAGFNPGDEGRTEPTAIHPPTEIPPA